MAVKKKLDENGLKTLISIIKAYVDNRLDTTAEQRYRDAMREYFEANGSATATPAELTDIVDRWYMETRPDWDGYVRFYHPDVSSISNGVKGGDNTGLNCAPSTNTTAGQDNYAGNPLFAPTDCNWIMTRDGDILITAIDGIECATPFTRTDPDVFVGVLQMTGYHWWTELTDESDYYYEGYSAKDKSSIYTNIEPLPEAIMLDNTPISHDSRTLLEYSEYKEVGGEQVIVGRNVRSWVCHSKYMSDLTEDNCMTSYSGGPSLTYVFSHNTSHTYAHNVDIKMFGETDTPKVYSGATICDNAFLILMARIKYASLTMDGIIQGCVNYSWQYPVTVGEDGVKRCIITTAQANNVLIGSNCLIGTYTTTIDRGQATAYAISGRGGAKVTGKEVYGDVDGVSCTAIYFDDMDSAFNTVANGAATSGTTYISSFIWRTGSCDDILGNDGSPTDPVTGREPAKLQGIEYMMGAYEVFADVILKLYQSGDIYYYEPYIVRDVSKQATSITNDYLATDLKIPQGTTAGWYYIKYMSYRYGVYFATQVGGSSTTYTRDGFGMVVHENTQKQWNAYGECTTRNMISGLYYIEDLMHWITNRLYATLMMQFF